MFHSTKQKQQSHWIPAFQAVAEWLQSVHVSLEQDNKGLIILVL
jgi:hypothetical protein